MPKNPNDTPMLGIFSRDPNKGFSDIGIDQLLRQQAFPNPLGRANLGTYVNALGEKIPKTPYLGMTGINTENRALMFPGAAQAEHALLHPYVGVNRATSKSGVKGPMTMGLGVGLDTFNEQFKEGKGTAGLVGHAFLKGEGDNQRIKFSPQPGVFPDADSEYDWNMAQMLLSQPDYIDNPIAGVSNVVRSLRDSFLGLGSAPKRLNNPVASNAPSSGQGPGAQSWDEDYDAMYGDVKNDVTTPAPAVQPAKPGFKEPDRLPTSAKGYDDYVAQSLKDPNSRLSQLVGRHFQSNPGLMARAGMDHPDQFQTNIQGPINDPSVYGRDRAGNPLVTREDQLRGLNEYDRWMKEQELGPDPEFQKEFHGRLMMAAAQKPAYRTPQQVLNDHLATLPDQVRSDFQNMPREQQRYLLKYDKDPNAKIFRPPNWTPNW